MKNFLAPAIVIIVPVFCLSQEQINRTRETKLLAHRLETDFGSIRNRYPYPITNIQYTSPQMKKFNLRFSVRIRSYGTLYFFSRSAYDVTPVLEYLFPDSARFFHFSAGAGADARLRFVTVRNLSPSSAEPLLSISLSGNLERFSFRLPFWMRFYTNGISFSVLPEVAAHFGSISAFIRYECSYLKLYNFNDHEFRQDNFAGFCWYISRKKKIS